MIQKTFDVLLKKLATVGRDRQLAVVDFWIGRLFLVRADIEVGRFPAPRESARSPRVSRTR